MLRSVVVRICMVAAASGVAQAQEGPVGTSGGPDVPFKGCIAFQHRDFKGAQFRLRGNVNVKYVGDKWNDKISSFACAIGCQMTFYEHEGFKGGRATWGSGISYVGSRWNDRISSLYIRCD